MIARFPFCNFVYLLRNGMSSLMMTRMTWSVLARTAGTCPGRTNASIPFIIIAANPGIMLQQNC